MIRGITHILPFEEDLDLSALPYNSVFYAAKVDRRDDELKELGIELASIYDEYQEAADTLARIGYIPELSANASAISKILSIDKGQFIQDLSDSVETLIFDMLDNPDPDEKWTTTAKLTLKNDKNMDHRKIVIAEVKSAIPAAKSGGVLYTDNKGNMLAVKEAVKQMDLVAAMESEAEPTEEEKAANCADLATPHTPAGETIEEAV